MNFIGTGKRLTDQDFTLAGLMIGTGEDEIHAVVDVEAAGRGFDNLNRPKMLFEPHIFYRELGPGPLRDKAVARGLAYQRWKPGAYPKDSYPRLEEAMTLHYNAALRSASWGLGQTMGFNHEPCGFITVHDMVLDYMKSEGNQLGGMIRFIVASNLDRHLRNHDWASFARGYNGPAYAANGYHTKLAKRYAFWAGIPDTPLDVDLGGEVEIQKPDRPLLVYGSKGEDVRYLQELLRSKGYSVDVDGFFGSDTEDDVIDFQFANDLESDGKVGSVTWTKLEE